MKARAESAPAERLALAPSGAAIAVPENVLLTGRLDQTDLFEICQFLLMGMKSGVLEIEAGQRRGALYFDQGQIVNAVDDALADGEQAAYRVFAWSSGSFVFRVQPAPTLRTIHQGTESLILDIARFLDERREERAQRGEGPEGDRVEQWTHEESIRQRQATGEELRNLFATLRGERGESGSSEDSLSRLWREARTRNFASVLLRPGDDPLGLRGGQVTPLPGTIGDDTVMMAIAALGAGEVRSETRRSAAGAFTVTLVGEADGEALLLQTVSPAMAWREVGLPCDWLEGVGGSARGLVWLGAPPAAGRSRTARALADELALRRRYTVLLGEDQRGPGRGPLSLRATTPGRVSDDLRQALHEGASAVILDLVRGVTPALVAHAAARTLVVACEPTPDLATLLARAARHARARAAFFGALFVSFAGERGHYESVWVADEARLGLDFERHPERVRALVEDPNAQSDAGPLSAG